MTARREKLTKALSGLAVLVGLVLFWEILSRIVTATGSYNEPLVPGWEYLWSNSLLRMADYWDGSLGVPSPVEGAPHTYVAAFLALGKASLITFQRVFIGVVCGLAAGVGLGILVSMSALARNLVAPSVHILRMTPFLAMIPLFNLWFGAATFGIILFVAYGVAVIMFIGTINAIGNVPAVYFDRARTAGAGIATRYRLILIPAIVPELRASLMLSIGLAWSLVVAGELLGAQEGLGVIVIYALQFAYTGRVMIIAFLFILYAGLSFAIVEGISRRAIAWHWS
jgi:ABC-type nitrate/sulfonate/bicarbonate transport system permease component